MLSNRIQTIRRFFPRMMMRRILLVQQRSFFVMDQACKKCHKRRSPIRHEDDDLAFRLIRSSRTTRMILPDRVAAVVPIVLDYLYARDDQQLKQALLPLTRDTATAVHYLASRLEMRRLGWEASQFWENDLALANCHVYYQHAKT